MGNKTIQVYLTSHFNNNKVSIKDYELATEMNKIAAKTKSYNPYTFFTPDRRTTLVIGLILAVIFANGLNPTYPEVAVSTREVKEPELDQNPEGEITSEHLHKLSLEHIRRAGHW